MGADQSAEASYPSTESYDDSDSSASFSSIEDLLSSGDLVQVQRCGLRPSMENISGIMSQRPKNEEQASKLVQLSSTLLRKNPSQCERCPDGPLSPEKQQEQLELLERIIGKVDSQGIGETISMKCFSSDTVSQGFDWDSPSSSSQPKCKDVLTFSIKKDNQNKSVIAHLVSRGERGLTITGHTPSMERIQKIIDGMGNYDDELKAIQSLTMSSSCASYPEPEFREVFQNLLDTGYSISSHRTSQ